MTNIHKHQLPQMRDSNIELLRIVSMILVMVVHADYVSFGPPTQTDISNSFLYSFSRSVIEAISAICVNVFVLISGWFGIRYKTERLFGLLFQVLFISILIYCVLIICGLVDVLNIKELVGVFLMKNSAYWFVRAYLVLYIFAPVLNSFVEKCDKNTIGYFLLGFFIVQSIYGVYDSDSWFSGGYSALSFMGIYILARYLKLYSSYFVKIDKVMAFSLFTLLSVIISLLSLASTYYFGMDGTLLYLYSSPLLIINSILFFLFFTKLSFKSVIINNISLSCFAIYLVHCSQFVFRPFYVGKIINWNNNESTPFFLLYSAILICIIFVVSLLIDRIRLIVWNCISSQFFHRR